jgi:hypothetical protein
MPQLHTENVLGQLAWLGLSKDTVDLVHHAIDAHNAYTAWKDLLVEADSMTAVNPVWHDLPSVKAVRTYVLAVVSRARSRETLTKHERWVVEQAAWNALDTAGRDACTQDVEAGLKTMKTAIRAGVRFALSMDSDDESVLYKAKHDTAARAVDAVIAIVNAKIEAISPDVSHRISATPSTPIPGLFRCEDDAACMAVFLRNLARQCTSPSFCAFIAAFDLERIDGVLGGNSDE